MRGMARSALALQLLQSAPRKSTQPRQFSVLPLVILFDVFHRLPLPSSCFLALASTLAQLHPDNCNHQQRNQRGGTHAHTNSVEELVDGHLSVDDQIRNGINAGLARCDNPVALPSPCSKTSMRWLVLHVTNALMLAVQPLGTPNCLCPIRHTPSPTAVLSHVIIFDPCPYSRCFHTTTVPVLLRNTVCLLALPRAIAQFQ